VNEMLSRVLTAESICSRIGDHVYPAHVQMFDSMCNSMRSWLLNSAPKLLAVSQPQDCDKIEPLCKRPRMAEATESGSKETFVPRLTSALVISARGVVQLSKITAGTSKTAASSKAKKVKHGHTHTHTHTHTKMTHVSKATTTTTTTVTAAAPTPAKIQHAFGSSIASIEPSSAISPIVHKPPPRAVPIGSKMRPAAETSGSSTPTGQRIPTATAMPSSGKKQKVKLCPLCSQVFYNEVELQNHISSLACRGFVSSASKKANAQQQQQQHLVKPAAGGVGKNKLQEKLAKAAAEDDEMSPLVRPPATPTQNAVKVAANASVQRLQQKTAGPLVSPSPASKKTPTRPVQLKVSSSVKNSGRLVIKSRRAKGRARLTVV